MRHLLRERGTYGYNRNAKILVVNININDVVLLFDCYVIFVLLLLGWYIIIILCCYYLLVILSLFLCCYYLSDVSGAQGLVDAQGQLYDLDECLKPNLD